MSLPPLFYLSAGSAFAAMIVALIRFSRLDRGGKALAVLCIVNAIELAVTLGMWMMKLNNLEVANTYRPIELLLIATAFWFMLDGRVARQRLVVLALAFLLVWIVDRIFFAESFKANTNMAMLTRIVGVIMAIIALHTGLRSPEGQYFRRPVFWMGTSVLVYSSGTILLLGFTNELISLGVEKFIASWQINWVFLLAANLLYIKGMLCKPQPQI